MSKKQKLTVEVVIDKDDEGEDKRRRGEQEEQEEEVLVREVYEYSGLAWDG